MSITPLTVPPKRLAQTISNSQLTFKMNNIEGWNGQNLTPADFGTEAYGVFINSTRTQIEIFSFDPATIADAEITINARGLGYSGQIVSDAGRQYAWPSNDTTIQLGTDAPQLFRDFMSESNTATVTAQHTYNVLPESAETPTDDGDFTTKRYVDGLTEPAVTVPVNQVAHGLTVGQVIRVSGANTFVPAQADGATNAEVVGIVTEVVDVDNFKYITEGVFSDASTPAFAAGTVVFLSRTVAGALTDTDTTTIGEVSAPLGIITQNGAEMIFHRYRPAVINTISGNPIASETVAGTVEEATQTQADAGDSTGETGAKLFIPPNKMRGRQINDYVVDTGAADAYVIAPSPAITAYAAGQTFTFRATNANTGASTLNVNGLGAVAITKEVGQALGNADIAVNAIITVIYDGTNFEVLTGLATGGGAVIQVFDTDGTWNKPGAGAQVRVQAWGAGGSGSNKINGTGGGGGGGAYNEFTFDIDDLGVSESVTVGVGGAPETVDDQGGNPGGDSSFGTHLTAYGGEGGNGGVASGLDHSGGGGGGTLSAGNGLFGGRPGNAGVGSPGGYSGFGGGGAGDDNFNDRGGDSGWGGGGGGGYSAEGGWSTFGGAGGSGINRVGGTSQFGGNGGAENTAGQVPGGGGGCGRAGNASGAGGNGRVIVTTY